MSTREDHSNEVETKISTNLKIIYNKFEFLTQKIYFYSGNFCNIRHINQYFEYIDLVILEEVLLVVLFVDNFTYYVKTLLSYLETRH